eukprot:5065572-Amphidinium_carterae.1
MLPWHTLCGEGRGCLHNFTLHGRWTKNRSPSLLAPSLAKVPAIHEGNTLGTENRKSPFLELQFPPFGEEKS